MRLKNPHDLFFKGTFGNVAVASDFLTNYLPESVVKHIDMDTLEPQKDSFIFIQRKTPTSIGGVMNAVLFFIQRVSKRPLKEDKASGGCQGFCKEGN